MDPQYSANMRKTKSSAKKLRVKVLRGTVDVSKQELVKEESSRRVRGRFPGPSTSNV